VKQVDFINLNLGTTRFDYRYDREELGYGYVGQLFVNYSPTSYPKNWSDNVFILTKNTGNNLWGSPVKAVLTEKLVKGENKEDKDVTSVNRNQYPDNGAQDNKYYIYKGII